MPRVVKTLLIGASGAQLDGVETELTAAGAKVVRAEGLFPDCALVVLLEPTAVPAHVQVDNEDRPVVLALVPAADPKSVEALVSDGVDDFLVWPRDRELLKARLLSVAKRIGNRQRWATLRANESEARHRLVFSTIPDAICVLDAETKAILEVNDAFLRQYGYSADETRSLTAMDLSNELEPTKRFFVQASEEGSAAAPMRWHRRKDGSIFPIEGLVRAFSFGGRGLMVAALRDISDRRTMEAQLLLADRMATVGTLAAGVAHEINNPLAYVLSNLSWLDEELARKDARSGQDLDSAEVQGALREALHGVARVRDIVRDLRTFAQDGGGGEGMRLDPRNPLEASLRMVANELRHRAVLKRELEPVPMIRGDEAQLAQVFLNLLTNALQALPERPALQNEIRVATRVHEKGWVAVEVADNGKGMTEDQARRVFDPFFTTRPVGAGQGLGLSVCLGIIRGLGGRIDVETREGKGSLFRILLPEAPAPQVSAPPTAPAGAAAQMGKPRVLVIDDEPLLVRSYARMLATDHEISTETDPRAALDRLRRGEVYDAILCDIMMPQMSGMDLHEELSRDRPDLVGRMGFLTGGAFTKRAREFLEARPDHSLEKPFGAEALRGLIARVMGRA